MIRAQIITKPYVEEFTEEALFRISGSETSEPIISNDNRRCFFEMDKDLKTCFRHNSHLFHGKACIPIDIRLREQQRLMEEIDLNSLDNSIVNSQNVIFIINVDFYIKYMTDIIRIP